MAAKVEPQAGGRTMTAKECARDMVAAVRQAMGALDEPEEAVMNDFVDEFEAELEWWKMRLDELEADKQEGGAK
jgi:hypothetical protein